MSTISLSKSFLSRQIRCRFFPRRLSTAKDKHTISTKNPTRNGKPESSTKIASTTPVDETLTNAAVETKIGHPIKEPPLLNPFPLLASATENIDLSSRLRSYSNTFGIIGALMCTISIGAISFMPAPPYECSVKCDKDSDEEDQIDEAANCNPQPILVKYVGIPRKYLSDIYMVSWVASFYTSAIGLGLSTVVAGIVAATAPAYVKIFVRRHSGILISLPICQIISGGFAGVGLFVGLDEVRGEPVSWIGLVGTTMGGALLGMSSSQVLKGYKAARAAGKLSSIVPKS